MDPSPSPGEGGGGGENSFSEGDVLLVETQQNAVATVGARLWSRGF